MAKTKTHLLKSDWERRFSPYPLNSITIEKLTAPYINNPLEQHTTITTGCSNSNHLLKFTNGSQIVLRIFIRDHEAIYREQWIYKYLRNLIPMPELIAVDDSCSIIPHPFTLQTWVDGSNSRDIIANGNDKQIAQSASLAGEICGRLFNIKPPENDSRNSPHPLENYQSHLIEYLNQVLNHHAIKSTLQQQQIEKLEIWIDRNAQVFNIIPQTNLVHGDFSPDNILLTNTENTLSTAAILDWEFAHMGSFLMDVGQYLRYSHRLPDCFKESFTKSLEQTTEPLPEEWETSSLGYDLICLLNLLETSATQARPIMKRDIIQLLDERYTL